MECPTCREINARTAAACSRCGSPLSLTFHGRSSGGGSNAGHGSSAPVRSSAGSGPDYGLTSVLGQRARRCPICSGQNREDATFCQSCGSPLADGLAAGSAALPPGTELQGGAFAIEQVLGQGGFGITYLGIDRRLRRPVAIKEFFPLGCIRASTTVQPSRAMTLSDYATTKERFLEEARAVAGFAHPNIVDVYGYSDENNTAYIIMEHLRGSTLLELIEARGTLPATEAIGYIEQVGAALEMVHARGLLHRDIKPDNVMICGATASAGPGGNGHGTHGATSGAGAASRAVLLDFGATRAFAAGRGNLMTSMLTPGYAPLEQYGQQQRFGSYTDVYALGATLYHMLTGQLPAQATDRAAGVELVPPHRLNPRVAREVSDVVMWAMRMKVDERPQSARAFVQALRAAPGAITAGSDMAATGAANGYTGLSAAAAAPGRALAYAPFTLPAQPPSVPLLSPLRLDTDGGYEVRIRAYSVKWPQQCSCCGGPGDTYLPVSAQRGFSTTARTWQIPYCTACLQHIRAAKDANPLTHCYTSLMRGISGTNSWPALANGMFFALAVIVGLLWLLVTFLSEFALAIPLLLMLAYAFHRHSLSQSARALMKPTCCELRHSVLYRDWNGHTHIFSFKSHRYAEEFRQLNEVNVC